MNLKFTIKKALVAFSGYWFARRNKLPSGVDLFFDLKRTSNEDVQVIFDVGANKGQSVSYFKNAYRKAHIYSFEPVKSLIPILKANTKRYSHVFIENMALGSKIGTKTIKLFNDVGQDSTLNSLDTTLMNMDPNAVEQEVEITTLDKYMDLKGIEQIDLLKLDVEKWEMEVLAGGLQNLKEGNIRYVLCEVGFSKINKRHNDFIEVFDYLRQLNFSFIGIYGLSLFNMRGHFGNALFKYDKIENWKSK